MAETEPDWAAIRRAVENGEGTQDEIAARHGVGKSAISMRKFRGGWMSPRDIEQMMRTEAALDQIAGAMLRRFMPTGGRRGAIRCRPSMAAR